MTIDDLLEWVKLATRWIHVFAAILWIGQTYLFNLERSLQRSSNENITIWLCRPC